LAIIITSFPSIFTENWEKLRKTGVFAGKRLGWRRAGAVWLQSRWVWLEAGGVGIEAETIWLASGCVRRRTVAVWLKAGDGRGEAVGFRLVDGAVGRAQFLFHAPTLRGLVGQWLSKLKEIFRRILGGDSGKISRTTSPLKRKNRFQGWP
jgi:hypothetical protein